MSSAGTQPKQAAAGAPGTKEESSSAAPSALSCQGCNKGLNAGDTCFIIQVDEDANSLFCSRCEESVKVKDQVFCNKRCHKNHSSSTIKKNQMTVDQACGGCGQKVFGDVGIELIHTVPAETAVFNL